MRIPVLIFGMLFPVLLSAQQIAKSITTSSGLFIGFYEYKPADYNTNTTTKYPCIIFLHGLGERGNGTTELSLVKKNAIPKYIGNGHPMRFFFNGKWETFIVLSPQLSKSYSEWQYPIIDEMISYASKNLRVDTNRIFLTGLSMGGGGTWKYPNSSVARAKKLAGISPVCGTCAISNGCNIAAGNLPVWAFHGKLDNTASVTCATGAVSKIQACNATAVMKVTVYPDGGHGIWDRAYDTTYKYQVPNIYQWFLAQNKSLPANKLPVAKAGNDITTPITNQPVSLSSTGSYDPDGNLQLFSWRKIAGVSGYGNVSNTANATATVTSLGAAGTFSYELTVVDNRGDFSKDTVLLTVGSSTSNQLPISKAGNDITITLPSSSVNVSGSASSDPDGSITGYQWSKVSGPANFTITSPTQANTSITGLVQGAYTFRLRVTDNAGATATDDINITVIGTSNTNPVARAGTDITLTLPSNSCSLNGSGSSDGDGTITGYSWSKTSGPSTFTIGSPSAVNTSITNLVQGTYTFRLTVTDNNGASAVDDVSVTVNAAPSNQPPVARAGSDITLTLPANSGTLNGTSSSDPENKIASYRWAKIAGPMVNIQSPSNASTTISAMVEGAYTFRLTITDDLGLTSFDDVNVTVRAAVNQLPVAKAGADFSITLPTNSATLSGSTSYDPEGSALTFQWTKLSGGVVTIASPTSANTNITGLVQGSYSFRLTVKDNLQQVSVDDINVTVNPVPTASAPVAKAGTDQTITLPLNSATLNASGSYDPDGTITGYEWSKVAGPASYSIVSPLNSSTSITNLVEGSYTFRLKVTDNSNTRGYDEVNIVVLAAPAPATPAPNTAPVAKAGADQSILLPANSVTLNGTASYDTDGSIKEYRWIMLSGPSTYTILNPVSSIATLSNLVEGTYNVRLQITDDDGTRGYDQLVITVQRALTQARLSASISEQTDQKEISFTVSPNPVSEFVNVYRADNSRGKTSIRIFDNNGRLIKQINTVKDHFVFRQTINIQDLTPGTYQIELYTQNSKRLVKRFMKLRAPY